MIISTWATALISKSNAVFDDVSTDGIREYLNDALVLHRTYIANRAKKDKNKKTELTFTADGYEIDIPTDMDDSIKSLLYIGEHDHNPIVSMEYTVDRGKIIFYSQQGAGSSFWIEYTAVPNRYDASSDDCVELDHPDIRMVLEKEVTKSAIKVEDDFDGSNATNNLSADANNVQR